MNSNVEQPQRKMFAQQRHNLRADASARPGDQNLFAHGPIAGSTGRIINLKPAGRKPGVPPALPSPSIIPCSCPCRVPLDTVLSWLPLLPRREERAGERRAVRPCSAAPLPTRASRGEGVRSAGFKNSVEMHPPVSGPTPLNSEARESQKHQTPNFKQQINTKPQTPNRRRSGAPPGTGTTAWRLVFGASLMFEV